MKKKLKIPILGSRVQRNCNCDSSVKAPKRLLFLFMLHWQ